MLKRLWVVLLLTVCLIGCQSQTSNALTAGFDIENTPKVDQWFKINKPDCKLEEDWSIRPYFHSNGGCANDAMNGEYILEDNAYSFLLNTDTKQCLTSEHWNEFNELLTAKMSEKLGTDDIECSGGGQRILVHIDFNDKKKKTQEVWTERENLLIWNVDIEKYADELIKNGGKYKDSLPIQVTIKLENFDGVEEAYKDFAILKEFPYITFRIESESEDPREGITVYYLEVENNKYKFTKIMKGVRPETLYEEEVQ